MTQAKTILFFSRGRGHGHAIPDMAIASRIVDSQPGVRIQFVSYATGAATLEKAGWDVVDLNLPENNGFLPTLYKVQSLISCLRPILIISHEEFAALAAARISGICSFFISAWLPQPGSLHAECLADANGVIVLGEPGIFPTPHPHMPRPKFVGSVVRKMSYGSNDRARARAELSIAIDATVIMVAAGGWATEARAPIAEVVLGAFTALEAAPKVLFWLAGRDHEALRKITNNTPGITVFEFCEPIERWMVASDVLITKGTRGLSIEAASLGLPSISLSHGLNPVDDVLVPRIKSNIALTASAVDADTLLYYINIQLSRGYLGFRPVENGLETAADIIGQYIATLKIDEATYGVST